MRIIIFLMLLCAVSNADSLGLNAGFGQGTKPFYGLDYEFNRALSYLDFALLSNRDYVQPYLSGGIQLENFNFGLATAYTSNSKQFTVGPEFGLMQMLNSIFYIKENNSYMGNSLDNFSFSATISIGVSF